MTSAITDPTIIQDSIGPIFVSETRTYQGQSYTVYNLQRDISWNTTFLTSGLSNDNDYIQLSAYQAIDGKGYSIYRTNTNCTGLIDISLTSVDSFNKAPIVGNFKYIVEQGSNEALVKTPPSIGSPPEPHYVIVNYVYLEGSTSKGGVLSSNCGLNGKCVVNNCISKQSFTTTKQGGIVSNNVGFGGEIYINNCVYIGDLNQEECGGIVGWEFCKSGNTTFVAYGEINNCFMIGDINADQCGGIAAESSFSGSLNFGGPAADASGVINNCYFVGNINNSGVNGSGGICGSFCSRAGSTNFNPAPGGTNILTINNSYAITNTITNNNGSILAAYCGGSQPVISGQAGTGEIILNNCVGKSPLNGTPASGGIITNNNSSTNLNDILGKLISAWSTTFWEAQSGSYPILRNYQLDIYSGYSTYTDEPILNFPIDPLAPIPQPVPPIPPIPPSPTPTNKTKKDNLPNTFRPLNSLLYTLSKRTAKSIQNKNFIPPYTPASTVILKNKIKQYGKYYIS